MFTHHGTIGYSRQGERSSELASTITHFTPGAFGKPNNGWRHDKDAMNRPDASRAETVEATIFPNEIQGKPLIGWRDEKASFDRADASGASVAEYVVLFVMCGIASVFTVSLLGGRISSAFVSMSAWFQTNVVACIGTNICPGW